MRRFGWGWWLLALALLAVLSPVARAKVYDKAYYGAEWMATRADVKAFVRGRLREEKPTLSPWDLPYVRELGHLYYMEDKDFSRLTAVFPGHQGGETVTEYYFFRDALAMIRVYYREEGASFQTLLESLTADYGKPRKEESKSPDEVFVQHRYETTKLILEVSYHPRRVERGFTCEKLTLFMIHRGYIAGVKAFHETLKKKYGKD